MVEQGLSSGRRSDWLSGNLTGDWEDLGSSGIMVLQMGSEIPVRLLGAPLSAGGIIDRRLPWCDDGSVLTHEDVLWSVRTSSHVAKGRTPLLHVQMLSMGNAERIAGGLSPPGKQVMAAREFRSVLLSQIEAAGDTMEGDAQRGIPSLIQSSAAIELRSSGKQVEELGLNQALSQGTGVMRGWICCGNWCREQV
ncbi:hypothetical protein NE237_000254 [Protea cynaroides]|uniref:Uncharacterized protein n=1 Tax=Protea cynaroides TaxID=273540 RepID=A0A9Q0QX08_9MAGN|nr:hypothetical protein NE237_000254 [Protea cynaroides]